MTRSDLPSEFRSVTPMARGPPTGKDAEGPKLPLPSPKNTIIERREVLAIRSNLLSPSRSAVATEITPFAARDVEATSPDGVPRKSATELLTATAKSQYESRSRSAAITPVG